MDIKRPTAGLLTILAMLGRLLPHPPNFTPVTGATLFGGAKLNGVWRYLLPISTMFLTDIFLGFHNTMPYVYSSFLVIAWLGQRLLNKKSNMVRVASVSLLSSILFFAVTNFGVWQVGGLYPHTVAGLIECYIMGLPFFGNTLLGDLTFSLGFFALYQWAENSQSFRRVDSKLATWLS